LDRISKFILQSHGLAKIPSVIKEILRVATNRNSTFKDLSNYLSADEVLQNRILKIARSALFMAPRSDGVENLDDAVRVLGFQTVANIAVSVAATEIFGEQSAETPEVRAFWTHSLACANFAELIKRQGGYEGDAFAAGFLHDIGKLLMLYTFQNEYRLINDRMAGSQNPVRTMEEDVLGMAHDHVNKLIVEKLKLPDSLGVPMMDHHDLSDDREFREMTSIVHLADLLCFDYKLVYPFNALPPTRLRAAFSILGVDTKAYRQLHGHGRAVVKRLQLWDSITLT
jgi:HD-like signal output (HDOD) protein